MNYGYECASPPICGDPAGIAQKRDGMIPRDELQCSSPRKRILAQMQLNLPEDSELVNC
jgi:hypothetical protein